MRHNRVCHVARVLSPCDVCEISYVAVCVAVCVAYRYHTTSTQPMRYMWYPICCRVCCSVCCVQISHGISHTEYSAHVMYAKSHVISVCLMSSCILRSRSLLLLLRHYRSVLQCAVVCCSHFTHVQRSHLPMSACTSEAEASSTTPSAPNPFGHVEFGQTHTDDESASRGGEGEGGLGGGAAGPKEELPASKRHKGAKARQQTRLSVVRMSHGHA